MAPNQSSLVITGIRFACAGVVFTCLVAGCKPAAEQDALPIPSQEEALHPFKLHFEERALVKRHLGYICALAYSPDGKILASGVAGGQVKLWSNAREKEQATLGGADTAKYCSLAFSPDGTTLAVGGTAKWKSIVRIWDVATAKEVAALEGPDYCVHHVVISPDGSWLAAAGGMTGDSGPQAEEYTVIIWDFATRKQHAVLAGHRGRMGIGGLAFAPDSQTLAVSCGDGSLKLWEVDTGKESASIVEAAGGGVAFTPDGKTLFGAAKSEITLTDVATSEIRARWKFGGTQARALALSKDGRLLAAAGFQDVDGNMLTLVQFWDTLNGEQAGTLNSDLNCNCVAMSPDGKTLASARQNFMIQLWTLERRPVDYPEGREAK